MTEEEYDRATRQIYGVDKPDLDPGDKALLRLLAILAILAPIGAVIGFGLGFAVWGWQ